MSKTPVPAVALLKNFLKVHQMTLTAFGVQIGFGNQTPQTGRIVTARLLAGKRLPSLDQAIAIELYTGIDAHNWWTDEQAAPLKTRAALLAEGKGPPVKQRVGRPANHEKPTDVAQTAKD